MKTERINYVLTERKQIRDAIMAQIERVSHLEELASCARFMNAEQRRQAEIKIKCAQRDLMKLETRLIEFEFKVRQDRKPT